MVEILAEFEAQLEAVRLLPAVGGVYEVSLDGRLVFSKLAKGRHAEPGEVMGLLRDKLPG
ncbi:MAG: Rdx family [Chloroflexota bacterium]